MSEQDINQAEQAKDQVDAEIKEDENLLEVKASMGDPSEVPDPIAIKAKKNNFKIQRMIKKIKNQLINKILNLLKILNKNYKKNKTTIN